MGIFVRWLELCHASEAGEQAAPPTKLLGEQLVRAASPIFFL